MVTQQPRHDPKDFLTLHADTRLGSLITVKLVVGEFADFKATPSLRRKGFEMLWPTAAARRKTIGMQAWIKERKRTPASNEFLLVQRREAFLESKAQVLFCRPRGRRDVDKIVHAFQATRLRTSCQAEIIKRDRPRFLRSGVPATAGRRYRPGDIVVCVALQKNNCRERFAAGPPHERSGCGIVLGQGE